ncbi:MAG: cob(I)yrinic acid a,c-diamide adenosyltransferase, partial [Clostridia bacterium]|nr:cob(I)yrinic acid a,c-diamide adenosyltransferase [Clostridia bacterium]
MIHIYFGEGKGKTTAATGLAARAAGSGMKVLFVQFFKDGSSGEVKSLKALENITFLYPDTYNG